MTDLEINTALALAIGWKRHEILTTVSEHVWIYTHVATLAAPATHRKFDYTDPRVIWPIAERYNCFPLLRLTGWEVLNDLPYVYADTAAKAVALAVIGGAK